METYFGKKAAVRSAGEFFALVWSERARMNEFLDWVEERRSAQRDAGFPL